MKRLTHHPTLALLILLTALFSFSGCQRLLDDIIDELGGRDKIERTIVELAQDSPDLSILVEALERADLTDALNNAGPFTVFAPDNHAFEALFNQLDVDDIYDVDIDLLTNVLLYHVVDTKARKRDLEDGQMIETLQGQSVKISVDGKSVFINGLEVLEADLKAANGIVHVIDGILMPPTSERPSVRLEDNDEFGEILVDAEGNTLYLFTPDINGESACTGDCIERWPVFYAEELSVGEGLDAEDFGTITRDDGSQQTTYEGWPLYFFQNDAEPGDVEGDGLGGVWFVAKDYTVFLGTQEIDRTRTTYLVNGEGLTLYYFAIDEFGQSNCTGGCLSAWPPFFTEELVLPSSLGESHFGTLMNEDGDNFTTYRNRPLYFFTNDNQERGVTNGQGVNDVWFVVPPDIDPLTQPTVVGIAQGSEQFSILVDAVIKAELAETLSGEGPFTVFAPNNEAFEALFDNLGVSGVDQLTKEQLTPILLYHVVRRAAVLSDALEDGQTIETLAEEDVTITITEDAIKVNDAEVILPDVEGSNGVVHGINQVLLPPTDS